MTGEAGRDKRWALFEQKLRERGLAAASIPKASRAGALAASFAQQRLLFLEQLTPGSGAYNDHYALRVSGRVDAELLGRVLDEIARRHEALRTTFASGAQGESLQVIHDAMTISYRQARFTRGATTFEEWVAAEGVADARAPFDLARGPLSRARLLSNGPDEHVLLFTIHHAVWDGWSSGVLARELTALYGAWSATAASPLPELGTQYADYSQWQRQSLTGEVLERKLAFWKSELAGAPSAIDLPTDRARPREQTFDGKTLRANLSGALSARVDARARELGRTPFAVLCAAFSVLLARYSGQRDLVLATPTANRPRVELEPLIGCFVNTLALRVDLSGEPTLETLASQISDRLLRAAPHQDLPFEQLVEALGVERDLSRSPVAQVMFVLQNTPARALRISDIELTPLELDAGFAKVDLTLNVMLTADGYATAWEFNTDLFDETTITRAMRHYEQLLERLVAAPTAPAFRVALLPPDERRSLLYDWNRTAAPFPDATLHALFVEQARRSPDAVALVVGAQRFTYAELAARARGIAHALTTRGVGRGDLVAVFSRRDAQLLPALLGALMCGAAYVPLDPAYPRDRLALILEDTRAVALLTTAELVSLAPDGFRERALDVTAVAPSSEPSTEHGLPGEAGDRAYIIYTSGSTGRPKGVEIEHRSAVAFVSWAHGVFAREELSGVLAATSVCFDLSIFEIFGTLLAGGTVILAENALSLPELPARSEVTLVNTVPSAAAELLRSAGIPSSVKTVNLAGEPLPEETVLRLYALPHVERVYNLYGPSETTTYSTYTLATRRAWSPIIGRPIANTRAYVLDEQLEPVPLGVRGELYLAGAGVARGYLERPELTAQRFLPDPFAEPGSRMYKTGDVARWRASGELEYLGRNDHQVKLRGFRIELGEIETQLRRQPSVAEAVVIVREDVPGQKSLVAYVVTSPDQPLAAEELRAALGDALPEYMVPARFVALERLPLSPNGKLERKRLPAPAARDDERPLIAPRTENERSLAGIWQEILRLERVSVTDSFFELGGDSIAAMRMSALARRAGLELSVSQIFQSPNIEALAERASRAGRAAEAKPLPRDPFPLSTIQRWFFERRLAYPNHYNQSLRVGLRAGTDVRALEHAVRWTVQRHSAFRLRFEATQQRFGSEPRVDVRTLDVSELSNDARNARIDELSNELERALDIANGPLGHVALFDGRGRADGVLFFVLHHLVVDVVSWHVLLSDVARAYAQLRDGAAEPAPVAESSNYAEYVARLASPRPPANAESAPFARLPRDFEDGPNLTRARETITWSLDAEATSALVARARDAYRMGVEDVTLAALCLALLGWTRGQRVALDVEKHGRDGAAPGIDLSDSVGWYTELIPISFQGPRDARTSLLTVKAALHGRGERAVVPPGPGAPEVVYNFLGNLVERDDASSPFVSVQASSAATNHHPENERSHLLEVSAQLQAGALEVEIAFSRDLHTRATISGLLQRFAGELSGLAQHLRAPGAGAFTPADFPLARLSQAELDRYHGQWWGKLEDAYALTPPQHAILVDVLRDPQAGYYQPQLHVIVRALDAERLDASLAWVLQRHGALRTAFAWSELSEPVQLVFKEVAGPSRHEDWRADDEPTRRQRLADYLARDRQQGFALDRAPLLRLLHARWTDAEDLLVWTIHHAVSDGWSLPIIVSEVLGAYEASARAQRPSLPPARPFRDYVEWRQRQDQARGEAYFRERLAGARAADLGFPEDPSYRRVTESTHRLDPGTCHDLEQVAKRHSVTLGAVIQAAWAVVVARYSAQPDVIFGSVDSGRPDDLERVAEMVGMFVTTLPLRVTVDADAPLAKLLTDVQEATLGIREHAHVALARVAAASGQPALFQSICVIENYPALAEGAGAHLGLRELASVETTRFPLTVSASTRGGVELSVSASLADAGAGPELLEAWAAALRRISTGPARRVGDIDLPQATQRSAARAHWRALLDDAPTPFLPTDRPRAAGAARGRSAAVELRLPAALSDAITSLARRSTTERASWLLAAFALYTARYAAEPELLLAVEGAPNQLLPLRVVVEPSATFEALARELERQLQLGRAHASALAPSALEACRRVVFSAQDSPAAFEPAPELSLWVRSAGGADIATFSYDSALFDQQSVLRMGQQWSGLALAAAASADRPLRELALSGAVGAVEEPPAATGDATTVLDLIRARARHAPLALAVLSEREQLSYAELDAQSSAGAAALRARGVTRGDLVGVHVPRSASLLVVLLSVMKAGAAFVALDVATPAERCRFMLEDCGAKLCVSDVGSPPLGPETRVVDLASLLGQPLEPSPAGEPGADDPAYVIYTSGSTGQPKGVLVEHASLLNYMGFYAQVTGVGPSDRLLQFASPSFDVSVEEIFGALCFGATLVLRSEDVTPRELLAACQALRVSIIGLPTAYWNEMTRALTAGAALPDSLRLVLIGGESASRGVLAEWQRATRSRGAAGPELRLLNMYGPTEATISATYAELTHAPATESDPPIGRPVAGALALVVDADGHPVPVGVPGELLLGGRCLARGYVRRPELTAEKFISGPSRARLYRTGDLVRWRGDGQLEYLRRIDRQVKLRGYRVELGEIEAALRGQPGVDDVVVTLRDDPENPRLVAYVVGAATPDELRAALAGLPPYMLPSAFVGLDRLPVTGSGKVDRRALPAPPRDVGPRAHVAPSNALESALLHIWQRILRIERLGVDRNFFELGGHSLLATQVVSRVHAELGLELSVRDVFEAPTVQGLARVLAAKPARSRALELVPRHQRQAPLSFAQARLWFLDQLEPGTAASNMPLALRVRGPLDVDSLRRALSEVGRRHAVLRARFVMGEDGQPLQRLDADRDLTLEVSTPPPGVDADAWMLEQARRDAGRPFDLATGPLVRARLLTATADRHVLSFNVHHIAADGWSISVLVRELSALYRAFTARAPSPLAELPIQYADYASWQREQLSGDELSRKLEFWKTELRDAPLQLSLPTRPGSRAHSYAGATLHFTLDAELSDGVDALALRLGATPFMVLLGAWAVLLSRVSGQPELLIGTPVANRSRVETEPLIGSFVNTLVLRADLRDEPSFDDLVGRLRERLLRAQAHEDLPFEKLVDALNVERDLERTPIFQAMFAMQNTPPVAFELPGAELSPLQTSSNVAKLDLTLNVERTPEGYASAWEYRTALFEPSFIESLSRSLSELLRAFIEAPSTCCQRAPLLSAAERRALPEGLNRTEREFPNALVHELIRAQAARTPEAPAVLDERVQLSYAALEAEAERLARHLIRRGARPETRIAVALDRSAQLVVALLAVLKSGAAYVPLDPSLPPARMSEIIEDARVELVLTETAVEALIPPLAGAAIVCIDRPPPLDDDGPAPLPQLSADTLAYVLFTSGSTGRPKGVEITHRALVNFLWSMRAEPGISASDRVLAATNLSFDIAGLELYLPLISGASVEIASRELATSGESLAEALQARGVTLFQATPSTYKMLLLAGFRGSSQLKLLVGGEPLSVDLARQLLERCASLWNVYGPTETTIWSTCARVTGDIAEQGISIGKPIANTQAFVLDAYLAPVPPGVLGELYLGGQGLARGYAGRPDLTAERFLPNPFGSGRLYRTGDVARLRRDGTLECFGRVDHQIKLRGFRIELGEIEAAIRRHPGVEDVAVDAQQVGADDKRLVAYVVSSTPLTHDELRRFLASTLPEYMLPAQVVMLDRLPTTPNGKLDRKALPKPLALGPRAVMVAPRDELERQIAAIYAELLHVPEVSVTDSFFDLGGHSLLGTELIFRLRRELSISVALKSLFEAPSVAALAAVVRAPAAASARPLPQDVVLARRGDGVPWFCFPALAGTAAPYLQSVVAGAGASVFLLESPGLESGSTPLSDVAAIARRFTATIRSVAPDGPVRLLGWSFGAVTAFVAARLLASEGRSVEQLLLLDPALPGITLGRLDERQLAAAFILDVAESVGKLGHLRALSEDLQARLRVRHPAEMFHVAKSLGIFPSSMSAGDFQRRFSVYTASARALSQFAPTAATDAYAGRARILGASAGNGQATSSWQALLPRADFALVEAAHYTILEHLRELLD